MSDKRDPDSADESEFGLGTGMIDSTARGERAIEGYQELWEIYSLPHTFDGSLDEQGGRPSPETTPVPRLLPGETEADRA